LNAQVRIFIAEDHTLLREGLKALIGTNPGWEIIGEAADGIETLERLKPQDADLLLIDLTMPRLNGVRVIEEIRANYPNIKILVLTGHSDEEFVFAALKAGADGYVVKDSTNEDLAAAIRSVMKGKGYLSPTVSMDVIRGYLEGKAAPKPRKALDSLTKREKEILDLVLEGHSNAKISELLYISIKTVEKHKTNLMRKLGVSNQNELRELTKQTSL
jgi:DNA-binding NarL/FixJ family response regulator